MLPDGPRDGGHCRLPRQLVGRGLGFEPERRR